MIINAKPGRALAALLATTGLAGVAHAGEVAGTVIDGTGTVLLQSAQVRIVELDRAAVTERDGSFYFSDLPAGNYTVEVSYVGAQTVRKNVAVPESGLIRVDIALRGVAGASGNEILVIGQAANQASALSRKRASDTVSDVVTRDAIGQFPDQNVAESLRRLPGVNVLNDQGEGRFVSVRGLDPVLNATSFNGVRLPAPESDTRQVALDVISSDIIESIEVKKSLTPDMDADTIGASVEIRTTSAFDRKKDLYTAKLEGSYNDYSGELTPKGSLDFSTRLSDNFGVSGGVSYYNRKFETDNIEADDWVDGGAGVFAQTVEYRDYDVERERISATLNFDFRASDTTKLYARGVWSQFDDHEYRRRLTFDLGDFDEDVLPGLSGNTATFDDSVAEYTIERDLKDRFERQRIGSIVIGGESDFGDWFADYSASYSKSTERENGSLDPAQFERDFDGDGLITTFDYSNARVPLFSVSGNTAAFLDPAGYELNEIEYTALSDAEDKEWAAKLDLGRKFFTDSGTFTVQGGAKARWRKKAYNKTTEYYENDDFTLADVVGSQTYRIADIEPVADFSGPRNFFRDNFANFELNELDSQFDSANADFQIDEDIMAAYLLGRWEGADLRVIGGVRFEHTRNDLRGNIAALYEEDSTLPDGTSAGEDTVVVTPTTFKRKYDHWLPSLNVRWEPKRNLVLRAAGYRSVVRPNFAQLKPAFEIEVNDDDELEGSFGNPDLKPIEAWNLDLSAEYYFASNGAVTAAFFYKDIKNYIVDVSLEDGTFNGIAYTEATIPFNVESARIVGFELGYSQAFTMLPSPLDGLILQANYTYTDSKGDFPSFDDPAVLRGIVLPATAKHTGNIVLGYEKGPISVRLAGTYRDKVLDSLEDPADRHLDDHFQLDLSAKYRLTENVQLFYEWVNINDAKLFAYKNFAGSQRLYQYERYNWTMKFGARLSF